MRERDPDREPVRRSRAPYALGLALVALAVLAVLALSGGLVELGEGEGRARRLVEGTLLGLLVSVVAFLAWRRRRAGTSAAGARRRTYFGL